MSRHVAGWSPEDREGKGKGCRLLDRIVVNNDDDVGSRVRTVVDGDDNVSDPDDDSLSDVKHWNTRHSEYWHMYINAMLSLSQSLADRIGWMRL